MKWYVKLSIGVVAVILAVAIIPSMLGMNTLPTEYNQTKAAWSQVENQYKRRNDLVRQVVPVVQGYAGHENSTLVQVREAMAKASQVTISESALTDPTAVARYAAAQSQMGTVVMAGMRQIQEAFPNLKADKMFRQLQNQIEGSENRLGVARRDYILSVQRFNTTLDSFPPRMWNFMYNYQHFAEFKAEEGAETAPDISQAFKR